jgi:hypothetical protein
LDRGEFISGMTASLASASHYPTSVSVPNPQGGEFQIVQFDFTGNAPLFSDILNGGPADWTASEARVSSQGEAVPVSALFVAHKNDAVGIDVVVERRTASSPSHIQLAAFAPDGDLFGNSTLIDISFDINRKVVHVPFPFGKLAAAPVGRTPIAHQWQWRSLGGPWNNLLDVKAMIYIALKDLTLPWSMAYSPTDGSAVTHLPEVDLASYWATGARSLTDIVRLITSGIAALSGDRLSQEIGVTHVQYTDSAQFALPGTTRGINLENFVDMVRGDISAVPALNCDDCAFAVASLSNVLGCSIKCVQLSASGGLKTRPFLPLGRPTVGGGFNNHVIAIDTSSSETLAYDASLRLHRSGESRFETPLGWPLQGVGGYLEAFMTDAGFATLKISESFIPNAQ